MINHPGRLAAYMLLVLSPPLSAQERVREGVILRQPTSTVERAPTNAQTTAVRSEAMKSVGMLSVINPMDGLSIVSTPPAPRLPTPTFTISDLSRSSGARTDEQTMTVKTSIAVSNTEWQACPLTPMFAFGPPGVQVAAAPYYTNVDSTKPPAAKYTHFNGKLYFRPPWVPDDAFPNALPTPGTATNSHIFVVNCRGEVSNALPFRLEPNKFQLLRVSKDGFIGGEQIKFYGTGLQPMKSCGNQWCAPTQKVMMVFKLGKTNAAGTGLDVIEREFEAPLWSSPHGLGERDVEVFAPSLAGAGYTNAQWVILESKAYVLKDGLRSNYLPVRYCSSSESAARPGACW
jgi:hypothetical protein